MVSEFVLSQTQTTPKDHFFQASKTYTKSSIVNCNQHIKLWVGILLTMARFFYPFMGIVIVDSFEALLLQEQRFERTDV